VSGKANEWVLIINNGNLRQAGVGLNTMRMPGDIVAKMPSKVNKVEFKAQQVTEEMSGVEVSAMICWTINRVGDGPMKAYTNLGKDISSGNPKTANQLITSMASAVMRNRIANIKVNEVLTNRQMLRQAVRNEISKVVTGWGVWLETVEITDVKIMSGSLFKNLQCKFREDQSKSAELLTMEVNNEITVEKSNYELVERKRQKDMEQVQLEWKLNTDYVAKKTAVDIKEQEVVIDKQDLKDNSTLAIHNKKYQIENDKKSYKLDLEYLKTDVDRDIAGKSENLVSVQQDMQYRKDNVQVEIETADRSAAQDRQLMTDRYKFQKELLADDTYMARKRAEVISKVYENAGNNMKNF